jgi:hypothetical protein
MNEKLLKEVESLEVRNEEMQKSLTAIQQDFQRVCSDRDKSESYNIFSSLLDDIIHQALRLKNSPIHERKSNLLLLANKIKKIGENLGEIS